MVPKTIALPLGYNPVPAELFTCRSTMEEGGFEPPNSERAVLQTAAFSHFATPPLADLIIITNIGIKCKGIFKFFANKLIPLTQNHILPQLRIFQEQICIISPTRTNVEYPNEPRTLIGEHDNTRNIP